MPSRGEIEIDGLPAHTPESRRRIGIAPQSLALYDEFTPVEKPQFFLLRSTSCRPRRIATVSSGRCDWPNWKTAAMTGSKDFSGGMKRRLNLATALVHDPEILLLDEPTVGVDPQSRNHIFDCIERLRDEGRTIIYTTHYMEEVERLCDQTAIIDHGRLLDIDTIDRLIEKHADQSSVTAELAHRPDTCRLPGTVEGNIWKFTSKHPFEEIARATSAGTQLATLNVARPSLEHVFLNLTGRSLRD